MDGWWEGGRFYVVDKHDSPIPWRTLSESNEKMLVAHHVRTTYSLAVLTTLKVVWGVNPVTILYVATEIARYHAP